MVSSFTNALFRLVDYIQIRVSEEMINHRFLVKQVIRFVLFTYWNNADDL